MTDQLFKFRVESATALFRNLWRCKDCMNQRLQGVT